MEDALWVGEKDRGAIVVPVREGLLIPSDSGLAFEKVFPTYEYEGCHMEMVGLLKAGSAAMLHWTDPYVTLRVRSRVPAQWPAAGSQALSLSLVTYRSARSFTLTLLGAGDVATIGRAYREVAKARGLVVPWSEKIHSTPWRAQLLGAVDFKMWSLLDRHMNDSSTAAEWVRLNWTFEEAAQVAEHLKKDLQIDKVLFQLGGWIRRGYDNQHPDILPAAPECGGNAALTEASRRIRACGYLLGFHDDYQDIYRDSPSWKESLIEKRLDGSLAAGGRWGGGQSYLICSSQALELARRPQNLPGVKALTMADAYFLDTLTATGLQDCFDAHHPLSRLDDMRYKQELAQYARSLFGVVGSECGKEWGVPCCDFFEGFTGVSGQHYHDMDLEWKTGAIRVPLFEMVYRDTIALFGKYAYDLTQGTGYVLDHLSLGRTLNYHPDPPHLYWKNAELDYEPQPVALAGVEVEPTGPRKFRVAYRWRVQARPGKNWRVFVHFADSNHKVLFQNDHAPAVAVNAWAPGEYREGPFEVEVPAGVKGTLEMYVGLFSVAEGKRAALLGKQDGTRRILAGRLQVAENALRFEPSSEPGSTEGYPTLFMRGDNGWGAALVPYDRFVKNTYEVMSPLHETTATQVMTALEFLTLDKRAVRTVFGEGKDATEVIVNRSAQELRRKSRWGGDVVLPRDGFLVDGPGFAAFCALAWGGRTYREPALFALRGDEGRPLDRARRVRIYHGFGDPQIQWFGEVQTVRAEATLDAPAAGRPRSGGAK